MIDKFYKIVFGDETKVNEPIKWWGYIEILCFISLFVGSIYLFLKRDFFGGTLILLSFIIVAYSKYDLYKRAKQYYKRKEIEKSCEKVKGQWDKK